MRPKTCSRTTVMALSAVLASGIGATMFGQETEPVFVNFEFGDGSIARLFAPHVAEEEHAISRQLAGCCLTNMAFWNFQSDSDTNFPQLHVFLEKSIDLRVIAELRPSRVKAVPLGFGVIAPAGEDKRIPIPNKSVLAAKIATCFDEKILSSSQHDLIFSALRTNCPVGKRALLSTKLAPPSGVLALSVDKYRGLSTASFRIPCRLRSGPSAGTVVELHSEGFGSEQFLGSTNFLGIGVHHIIWLQNQMADKAEVHTNDFSQLVNLPFYLENLNLDATVDVDGNVLNISK